VPNVYRVVAEIQDTFIRSQDVSRNQVETWMQLLAPALINDTFLLTPPAALGMRLYDDLNGLLKSGEKSYSIHCLVPLINADRFVYALCETSGYRPERNTALVMDIPHDTMLNQLNKATQSQVVQRSLATHYCTTKISTVSANDTPALLGDSIPMPNVKSPFVGSVEAQKAYKEEINRVPTWAERAAGAMQYDYMDKALILTLACEPMVNADHFPPEFGNREKRNEFVYERTHRYSRVMAALGRSLATYFRNAPLDLVVNPLARIDGVFVRNLMSNNMTIQPPGKRCSHSDAAILINFADKDQWTTRREAILNKTLQAEVRAAKVVRARQETGEKDEGEVATGAIASGSRRCAASHFNPLRRCL
jgi:hypothetical protein